MLKRQSESALQYLIKFYTVKIQNMQKHMQNIYKYAKMQQNILKYAKMQKIISKFASFSKPIIGFKGRRFI